MSFAQFLRLFGERFQGASYRAMRSFCAATIDHAEPEDPELLAAMCGGRSLDSLRTVWRYLLLIGRRGGKTAMLALIMLYTAVCRRPESVMPGEQLRVVTITPSRAQSRVLIGYVKGLLAAVGALGAMVTAETAEAITLSNDVVIEVATASFRHVRGYTYLLVCIDEAAFLRDEDGAANPLGELLNALEPGMSTVPGAKLFMISTVYSQTGVVFETFRESFGKEDLETLALKATTRQFNPNVAQSVIDRALARDPSAARAEYLSEWREDVETFLARSVIDAVIVLDRRELPRVAGVEYRIFFDFAGGSGADSATLAVAHSETRGGIVYDVLDCVVEVRPPFSPASVCAEFATVCKRYGVGSVISDRWGGQFPVEGMRAHGILVTPAAKPKSELYLELAPKINSRSVELLDLPRLTSQLAALERRTGRGRDSVDHPSNGHDDMANAVAGVLTMQAAGAGIRCRSFAESGDIARGWNIARIQREYPHDDTTF